MNNVVFVCQFCSGQLFANLDRLFFVSENIREHIFAGRRISTPLLKTFDSTFESTRCQLYAYVFLRPQLLQNINCSMLKHVKNSQIDSKMTCSMYDSNFSGVVEVVKRHARIADTLFFQTRYRTFSTKEL